MILKLMIKILPVNTHGRLVYISTSTVKHSYFFSLTMRSNAHVCNTLMLIIQTQFINYMLDHFIGSYGIFYIPDVNRFQFGDPFGIGCKTTRLTTKFIRLICCRSTTRYNFVVQFPSISISLASSFVCIEYRIIFPEAPSTAFGASVVCGSFICSISMLHMLLICSNLA